MSLYRTIFCIVLALPLLSAPGRSHETQDQFESELTEAAMGKDSAKVHQLISEHRLWVKPVVNQLITEYIHRTMTGAIGAAQTRKEAASLISGYFRDIYREKSLSIGTGYLDQWTLEQLGKKAQADRNYGIGTDLRLGGGDPEETITRYQQALKLYKDIGDVRGQGEVLGGLGAVYWYIDPDTCISYYQQALKARIEADDQVLIASMLNGIGGFYLSFVGDTDSAGYYLVKAADVRRDIGDLANLVTSLTRLGHFVYEYRGELEEAILCYKETYSVYRQLGDLVQMADARTRSGTLLRRLGRYPEARQDLEMARDLGLELSDTLILADACIQLAMVYDNIGDYETGIELVTTATRLHQQINDQEGLAGAYHNTGIILQDAGRKARAEEFYKRSLEIFQQLNFQENVIHLMNDLGTVTFEQNDYKSAEAYLRRGLELSRALDYRMVELPSLINLANTQNRLNQLDSALINYELALNLSRQMNSPDSEWRILVGMAENYKIRGDYTKALEYNEEGLNIIEDLRSTLHNASDRSKYLARERYAFEDVIHMLATQHQNEADKGYDLLAFEYAQRCKSRSFLEQIEGSDPVNMEQIQHSGLDKNSVILEYSLGDSSSVLWVITPDAYEMIQLPDQKKLEEQVETLRFALLNPNQDNKAFLQQAGYYLYDNLIAPAEQHLSRKSQLVILPDGILHYVPFEVLITREPLPDKNLPYGKLNYLGLKYPISYGQSASALVSTIADRKASDRKQYQTKELGAFGDPVYAEKYKRLEYSGQEVKNIAALFPEDQVSVYLKENALEKYVKNDKGISEFQYIHFATHAVVDEQAPGRSGLVLTQVEESPEEGILRADEIAGLKLNSDLVVLSACQTGVGKMIRGEGMIGLSRSFIYSGAPSVVVSLWSVSDQSTSMLMQRFYENLVVEDLTKTEALHEARISLINDEQFAHPFFWAPFVLTGDWK